MGVELKLSALVELVAKRTGATFVWDPTSKMMEGRLVRLTRDIVKDGSADLALLRRVLSSCDQALVPMGEAGEPLFVIMDARQQGAILKLKAQPVEVNDGNVVALEQMDGVFVTATIRVDGMANLRDLRQALSRLVTGQNIGNVSEVPDGNVVIVTDFAPNVAAIYRTVRQVEAARTASPGTGRTVEIVELRHAKAIDLAELLSDVFAPAPLTQVQQNSGLSPGSAPRILADARTNRLVVAGTSAEVQAVLATVQALDIAAAPGKEPPPGP
jgi:type II secretory pathway component GspD/PulD (secretin)